MSRNNLKKTLFPPITVLMAVYNAEKYLTEAVTSILDQTYVNFEFLIIDDASTDTSPDILQTFSDSRIRIIRNDSNMGLTKSLNKGLKESKGIYVARMDADDISLPERLKVQKDFLDTHPEIVCVGGTNIIIDANGAYLNTKKTISNPNILKMHMILKNQISHPSVMFRKESITANGGYSESYRYAQDYELWSRLLLLGFNFSNIDEPIIKYRLHDSSITQGKQKNAAYQSAIDTTYKNVSQFITLSENAFVIFMESLHKQKVTSIKNLLSVINTISRFEKSYFAKQSMDSYASSMIREYLSSMKKRAFQWYMKSRFASLYAIAAKIKTRN